MTTETIQVSESVEKSEVLTICDCCGQAETAGLDDEVFEVVVDPEVIDTSKYTYDGRERTVQSIQPLPTSADRTRGMGVGGARADLCGECCDRLFGSSEFDGVVNNVEWPERLEDGGLERGGDPPLARKVAYSGVLLVSVALSAAFIGSAAGVGVVTLSIVALVAASVALGMRIQQ